MPRDLLEVFFELQKAFNIVFEEKDVIDSRFDMLPNIVECIYEKKVGMPSRYINYWGIFSCLI